MSINYLNAEYVIIFSLVQYSTAMVSKSPNYYISRSINKPYKTTFHIHKTYKTRKNLDYNYQDWEEKKPVIYDYSLPTTNHTSSIASDLNINETSPQEMFRPEIPANPILESSPYNTLYSSSSTYPTLPSNESTADTSLPTPSIDSNPMSVLPSFSTPYNTTTPYNITPPYNTTLPYNIITLTPELTETIIMVTTTPPDLDIDPLNESIREELLEAKTKLKGGFFTASIYVLFNIIERKKSEDVTPLLFGLQGEISRLNSHHRLAMFGPMVNSVFTVMVLQMTSVPVELIQTQAKTGQTLLRKIKAFHSDTRAVFDVIDSIYIEEDYNRIVDSLTDIQKFPHGSKREIKVAEEAIAAFILLPYNRIEGTAKEKVLQLEVRNFVEKRMAVDENKIIRRHFRNHVKITTEMTSSSENIIKFRGNTFTKAHMRMEFEWPILYTDPTTIISSEKDYTSNVTDPQIMKRLRHQMIIYKKKIRKLRSQEKTFKTKKGMTSTTTTTTTTTTKMPPMHKSKYYMEKYVKKNLYKMKISTPKTTIFHWKYYGKNRTKTINNFKKKIMHIDSLDVKSSESEDYYSDSEEDDYETDAHKSNDFTRSMTPTIFKTLSRFNTNKNDITNHILYNNVIKGEESKMEFEDNHKIQRFDNKPDSSDSNAEAYIKVNLNDALFHTNKIIDRRFKKKKVNNLLKMDSFSDDEAILKGNIYKVFGYRNDFAKQLRAVL